ncbi:MAG: zinc ABC transporter substrate-binding protein [Gammaproteobacteria bacterium]|nr:zinc ABC transporter substrate-binding protein [Gammaproteobacteria bacterium]
MNTFRGFSCALRFALKLSCCFFGAQVAMASDLKVVASIAPVHSLVSEVIAGTDVSAPELLIQGKTSPHSFTLRPSDVRKLQNADILFLISETLETSTMHTLESLEFDTSVIELMNTTGMHLVHMTESDSHENGHGHVHGQSHSHGHEHDATHPMSGFDHHIWLDPANAIVMVDEISGSLSELDPDNSTVYEANANRLRLELEALTEEIASNLKSAEIGDFIVFHDAYKSFEHRFGLTKKSHPVLLGETRPGARRMQELRNKLMSAGVQCVFKEPQYDAKILDVLIEGTDARVAELDPLGVNLETGSGQYFAMMRNIATTLTDCLSQ